MATPKPQAISTDAPPSSVVRALPVARDDASLLAGLSAGEAWARAGFFDRYAPVVGRTLRGILGPSCEPELEDLIHDTFVEALGSLHRLRDTNALQAWIHSIATHVGFRTIRRRMRRRWLCFWDPAELEQVSGQGAKRESREACLRTYALLERMPTDQRVAFALRYIEGMELTDVAAACDVSLGTIKRRLQRAEKRFAAGARNDDVLCQWVEEGERWKS